MNEIKEYLVEIIKKYTGVFIEQMDRNIFEYDIMPLDMLYVVEELEHKYNIAAKSLFRNNGYEIMSINNLAQKIKENI